jgi:hypothetical protein
MKRHRLATALSIVGLALATLTVAPVEAAQPPRVNPESCSVLSRTIGPAKIWRATFWGKRQTPLDPFPVQTLISACFSTKAKCTAWLYWAQSDWQQSHVYVRCKQGG